MKDKVNNQKILIHILRICCVICILAFIPFSIFGQNRMFHIDVEEFFEKSSYYLETDISLYQYYPDIEGKVIKGDTIHSLQDLIDASDTVAIVTINDYSFSGSGLLAACSVDKYLKGENSEEIIEVYDQIQSLDGMKIHKEYEDNGIYYFDGNIPLKKGEQYVVFLNNAINPVKEGTYMYTTDKYGAFRITKDPKVLEEYNSDILKITLKEAAEYDMICKVSQELDTKKLSLFKEIFETYGEYSK